MARFDTVEVTLTGTDATSVQAYTPSINGIVMNISHVLSTFDTTQVFPTSSTLSIVGAEWGMICLTSVQVSTGLTTMHMHPRVELEGTTGNVLHFGTSEANSTGDAPQVGYIVYVNERLLVSLIHGTTLMGGDTPANEILRFVIDGQVTREE